MRILAIISLSTALSATALAEINVEETLRTLTVDAALARGEHAYRTHCATCHGVDGKGNGPSARWLDPPPRDFTRAEYRWRTTPTGGLPTDSDILRTIDDGAFGTSMPAWKDRLAERTRRDLVQYLKTFSPRFQEEEIEAAIEIPDPPAMTPEMLEIGKQAYERVKCWDCHGRDGRGDGPSAKTLKDSVGRRMDAYDFTKGFYKAGSDPRVIYRTYMTGLNGTPMPAYDQTTKEEERWPLVFYTMSLHRGRGVLDYLFAPMEEQQR